MRFILNSAVITSPGTYDYRLVSVSEAKTWVEQGEWLSYVGYPETAAALGMLLSTKIPVDRRTVVMHPGDEALVFRLVLPPGSRRPQEAMKGVMGRAFVEQHSEMGILRRLH